MALRATPGLSLHTSRDGDSTTSLGSQLQCLNFHSSLPDQLNSQFKVETAVGFPPTRRHAWQFSSPPIFLPPRPQRRPLREGGRWLHLPACQAAAAPGRGPPCPALHSGSCSLAGRRAGEGGRCACATASPCRCPGALSGLALARPARPSLQSAWLTSHRERDVWLSAFWWSPARGARCRLRKLEEKKEGEEEEEEKKVCTAM